MRQEQSDDGDTSLLEGALQCTLDSLRHCLGRSRPASLEKAFEGPLPQRAACRDGLLDAVGGATHGKEGDRRQLPQSSRREGGRRA